MNEPGTVRCGAWYRHDGRVRFRLWAPAARQVELMLGDQCLPMSADAAGFYEVTAAAAAGSRYRYRIDGGAVVPDPASRWQPDGLRGASAVLDDTSYTWRHAPLARPWHELVIYEVHLGCSGGYAGLQAQLPTLAASGITALELMPLAQFPGRRNWGYDGVLPFAPAEAYGTPDQLKSLIDAAHGLGMAVLLDVVYNHLGPYDNHMACYAPGFSRHDRATPWGDAIDFRQPPVQQFFIENALMWLRDYRFDGLRLDAAQEIQPSRFLGQLADTLRAELGGQRQIHLVLENEHRQPCWLHEHYQGQWNNDFHHALHVMLTEEKEGYYRPYAVPGQAEAALARCLQAGFSEATDQRHASRPARADPGQLPLDRFVVFAQNHDQIGNRAFGERLSTLVDPLRARLATALTLLTPMTPMVFMGEPWQSRAPFLYFIDLESALAERVREGRRHEFRGFLAFGDAQALIGLPDPNAPVTLACSTVALPTEGDSSQTQTLEAFTHWAALRRRYLWPAEGAARPLGAQVIGPRAVSAGWQLPAGQWWLAFNAGDAPVAHGLPAGECVLDISVSSDRDHAACLAGPGLRVHWRPA